ncbi:long chain acyl-CoA synthetase [Hanamia caeni]|uniref:Long chain acyl-CoA synthetase n=1 Tax=Hanamia caeni TaxID=2294116 RepID=A0A3M9NJK5_9BACT|nr:AMP-binding protein [Hanamia caeni]RNI37497.1 long chain acyl-CoA synthetase [Hanamia caeni]
MISIPQRLLGEALLLSAKNNPSKTAVIVKEQEYSFSQLKENVENLAGYLINAGIKKGDRIAIYMDNSWQSIVSIYGITLSGGVFLVINPQTKADKLKYILNDCEAKILISTSALKNELSRSLEGTKYLQELIITGEINLIKEFSHCKLTSFEDSIQSDFQDVIFPNIIPNDLAALIYTSGSTGFPKGVMMTHQAMVFTSWSLIEYLRLSEDDRIMLILPLAFDYGLYQLLLSITIGGTLIVEQSFIFTASIYKNIRKYKPTVFPGVPTIYAMMITANKENGLSFDCIEKVTNTAALLPAEFIPDLKKIFPNALIFKMYGLTECKRVCYLEPELIDEKPGSVGKAIPGTEVSLLSADGKPVAAGEPGILHVRGPHVMLGYLNKKELSEEMLKEGKLPGEKILCSNDWFKMDEDGFLYFQGRNDDIIKTRGEKVSPVEIENIIYKMTGIKEVAVLGIPDMIMGESILVYITLHEKAEITEKEIQRECMMHLEPFMIPQKVIFLSEMPKSTNGKIDKKELKKMSLL